MTEMLLHLSICHLGSCFLASIFLRTSHRQHPKTRRQRRYVLSLHFAIVFYSYPSSVRLLSLVRATHSVDEPSVPPPPRVKARARLRRTRERRTRTQTKRRGEQGRGEAWARARRTGLVDGRS